MADHGQRSESVEHAAKAEVGQRRRRGLDERLLDVLGHEWCGNGNPPLSNRGIYVHEEGVTRVFSMVDDGGFVGVGYPDEWHVIMRTEAARLFALWTLWLWACDWFGIRSAIYYRALHHKVKGSWRLDYKRRGRWRNHARLTTHERWRAEREAIDRKADAAKEASVIGSSNAERS